MLKEFQLQSDWDGADVEFITIHLKNGRPAYMRLDQIVSKGYLSGADGVLGHALNNLRALSRGGQCGPSSEQAKANRRWLSYT